MERTGMPPLPWLRAFEAAGRLGSFKAAAAALHVSPSTISHQVQDLERHLATPLFSRGKPIGLTREGERYLAPLTAAFELLRSAADALEVAPKRLRIGAFPFLINEVLVPNVVALRAALDVERISFHAETRRDALLRADPERRLDVLVRYHDGSGMPGFVVRELCRIELVPVKAPGSPSIANLAELLAQPIVRVLGAFDGWRAWGEVHGVNAQPSHWAMETDSYHAALLAVARGEGICLGIWPLIRPWVSAGRIEMLEPFRSRIRDSACLLYAPHQRDNPTIERLHDWLVERLR
jgi:LysR family transcriptional regulator, glycine cleavage system transcriptional activator